MRRLFTMRQALSDPDLLGGVLEGESWSAWRTMLIALMGEELTAEERIVFTSLTGRDREPGILVEEFWAIVGRRGGKTRAMSALATYIAGLCEYDFAPGERGVIPIMAASKQQANVAFQYIAAVFARPPFDRLKIGGTADSISLSTGVDIQVRPASSRTIRGLTAVAVIADEIAYWATDESTRNPDAEVLNAVRPALATTFGPLIVISSPHARRGELWETYRRHFGP
jgi:phage terminase large subunit-like protein